MKTLLMGLVGCFAFLTHTSTSGAANCVQIAGLVSWWPAESNAVDAVDGNTGVLLNGATFAPGKSGQAFSLTGGAHVRIADNANLHLTNGLTIAAWVNPNDAGYSYQIISKWDVNFSNQKSYAAWLSQSKFIFSVAATGDDLTGPYMNVVSANTVPPNQWTHVAATYDGATMKVYVNGQLDNQGTFTYGIYPGTNDLAIGATVGGVPAGQYSYSFEGRIDEPAIYNRALSAAEIQAIYVCQPPPSNCLPNLGLVSWWPAEGNPVDAADGNTGVLLNGATFAPGKLGQAFSFNGSGAHVRIADNVNLHLTNGLTLQTWVNPTDSGYSYPIISKWDVVFEYQKSYNIWLSQSKFIFTVCANGDETLGPHADLVSVGSVTPNQWTHVAATYDGSTMKVYLNGQLDNQAAFPYGIFAGTGDLGIGAVVGGVPAGQYAFPFSGRIDEPAIYNRALSAAEIQAIYACQPLPTISLGFYLFPGLTINASAGQTVAIQYVTNLTSLNWVTITNLTITQVPQLWIDTANNVTVGDHPQRFYRAVPVP